MLIRLLCILWTTTLAVPRGPVQTAYVLSGEHLVTIRGTSTIRNWLETVGDVRGKMMVGLNDDGSLNVTVIRIDMNVGSIKSDMGKGMDKRTYEALKGDVYPNIAFLVDVPEKLVQIKPGAGALFVKGSLTLAGRTRAVLMRLTAVTVGRGWVALEGMLAISMTDYGVKPPGALFGTIKADPAITIFFKTTFTTKQNQ